MTDRTLPKPGWHKLAPFALAAALAGLPVLTGCSRTEGVPRYDLSGEVTYGGQPVPSGYISFRPDREQGNRGPGTSAGIFEGRYETDPGQGTVGGPHIAVIHGTDGVPYQDEDGYEIPVGRPLFPKFTLHIDLPKEPAIQALEVPRK